jgi:DNA processing protein
VELDDSLHWLGLLLTPGLGARLIGRLVSRFGSPERVFRANPSELETCRLPKAVAASIHGQRTLSAAEKEIAKLRRIGGKLLCWDEPAYSKLLLSIPDPPPLLYFRGDPNVLNRHVIAIIGTRRPTLYGNQVAEQLGRDLAARDLVIANGLARGIDASAQRGSYAAAWGGVIGVLGTGLDLRYQKENRKFCADIEKRGAIISEFPLGTPPLPENFPIRNRIIAGLALGAVLVQGQQYCDSINMALVAMKFGRTVYAVPGNVTEPMSFAPNQLICQGAKLVTNWKDVVEELPIHVRAELRLIEERPAHVRELLLEQGMGQIERKVYALLKADESLHVDDLAESSGLSSSELLAALCEMEMRGVVRQLPGKQFLRALV